MSRTAHPASASSGGAHLQQRLLDEDGSNQFLANLELGYLTPPVGMNLFLSSHRFNQPLPVAIRPVVPMFLVLLVGVLLITYVPPLTTMLPYWLG